MMRKKNILCCCCAGNITKNRAAAFGQHEHLSTRANIQQKAKLSLCLIHSLSTTP
jgi:hypothetical protein